MYKSGYVLFLIIAFLFLNACAQSRTPIPQSTSYTDDPELALMGLALDRLLYDQRYFPSELSEMRKSKEVYLHTIRVDVNQYPFPTNIDDFRMDTLVLDAAPSLQGYNVHLITKEAYQQIARKKKRGYVGYLVQSGNVNISKDSATVIMDVFCVPGRQKHPVICLSGGSIQYLFRREGDAWKYDSVLRHLQS